MWIMCMICSLTHYDIYVDNTNEHYLCTNEDNNEVYL